MLSSLYWSADISNRLCALYLCSNFSVFCRYPLRWRRNGRDSDSNHQPHGCLLNGLFRRRSRKTSKLRVTGLCVENSPGTGEFPAQMASNAEDVSIWWRHHALSLLNEYFPYVCGCVCILWLTSWQKGPCPALLTEGFIKRMGFRWVTVQKKVFKLNILNIQLTGYCLYYEGS